MDPVFVLILDIRTIQATFEFHAVIRVQKVIAYRYVEHRVLIYESSGLFCLFLVRSTPYEYEFLFAAVHANDSIPPLDLAREDSLLYV